MGHLMETERNKKDDELWILVAIVYSSCNKKYAEYKKAK